MLRNKVTRHEDDSINDRSAKKVRLNNNGFINLLHHEGKQGRNDVHAASSDSQVRILPFYLS
jgi:hypothetical protein